MTKSRSCFARHCTTNGRGHKEQEYFSDGPKLKSRMNGDKRGLHLVQDDGG